MRLPLIASVILAFGFGLAHAEDGRQAAVLKPVMAFYRAFDEGFVRPADFATDDWNHINPGGGRTRGREAVLAEVRAVHKTFLKGTTDTPLESDVRFAGRDAAVVTVTSVMSPYAMPGGPRVERERHIRTFVVVRSGRDWKVMQDHNTTVVAPPAP
jgi:uncharacterized protein (TIGR02246 family)